MSKSLCIASLCVLSLSTGLVAQQAAGGRQGAATPPTPPASTSAEVNAMYTSIANFISRTAAMVPADKLSLNGMVPPSSQPRGGGN